MALLSVWWEILEAKKKNVVQLFNCQHQVFFKLLLALIMVAK